MTQRGRTTIGSPAGAGRAAPTDRSRRFLSISPVTRPSLARTTGSSQPIFPGILRRELTAALSVHGEAPVVLFVNGAAGDVSTRPTRRGQDVVEVERIGKAWRRRPEMLWRLRTRSGDRFGMAPHP